MKAVDYKGKWFVLVDEIDDYDFEREDIDIDWALNKGLETHVESCLYYGIPAYIGSDKSLKEKIKEIEQRLLKKKQDYARSTQTYTP